MNQRQFDRAIQLVLALGVLAVFAYLVSTGDLASESILQFLWVLLPAFGFEAGRRVQYRRVNR